MKREERMSETTQASETIQIPEEERKYLDLVESELHTEIEKTRTRIAHEKKEVLRLKQYLYEASASDMDEAEVISGMEDIDEQVALAQMDVQKEELLTRQIQNPYFGKMIFRFDDDGDEAVIYVGMQGFWSQSRMEQVIYDWRAPVSGMFYDYEIGKASYQAPMGEVCGTIASKKQISIEDGCIKYVIDTTQAIQDELLLEALKTNSSYQMHTVAATIQKEQNKIIRDRSTHTLIVDGRAGSGKTVVALHRVAWLLYYYRKKLRASDILILSPNSVFSDYISGILPELGEEAVPQKEWDMLMDEMLFIDMMRESKMDQANAILESRGKKSLRLRNIKIKSSIAFFDGLNRYLEQYTDGIHFTNFRFQKQIFPKERTEVLFHQTFRQYPPYERFAHIAAFIVDDIELQSKQEIGTRKKERLIKEIQKEMVIRFAQRDMVKLYADYLKEACKTWPDIDIFVNEDGKLCYEDSIAIFYLQLALYGCSTYRELKHLVVDEMQDYNVFQYASMQILFPCPKTILGDQYQVLFFDPKETVLDVLTKIFPDHELKTMQHSYRSTRQITMFCSKILGLSDVVPFARDGKEPEVIEVASVDELKEKLLTCIREFENGTHETAAVLVDDESEAEEYYRYLSEEGIELSIISENSAVYFGGIAVIPKFFAKGMEFDAVYVINHAKREDDVAGKHEYYISCTRALHELYAFQVTEKSE